MQKTCSRRALHERGIPRQPPRLSDLPPCFGQFRIDNFSQASSDLVNPSFLVAQELTRYYGHTETLGRTDIGGGRLLFSTVEMSCPWTVRKFSDKYCFRGSSKDSS